MLKVINEMLKFCHKTNTDFGEAGAVMHDGTAIIYYCKPELFSMVKTKLHVSEGEQSYGKCELDSSSEEVKFGAYSKSDKVKEEIVKAIKK